MEAVLFLLCQGEYVPECCRIRLPELQPYVMQEEDEYLDVCLGEGAHQQTGYQVEEKGL